MRGPPWKHSRLPCAALLRDTHGSCGQDVSLSAVPCWVLNMFALQYITRLAADIVNFLGSVQIFHSWFSRPGQCSIQSGANRPWRVETVLGFPMQVTLCSLRSSWMRSVLAQIGTLRNLSPLHTGTPLSTELSVPVDAQLSSLCFYAAGLF